MWQDALTAPYLCTDATGVLVQAKERCRRGHFWVVAAPERHVLFAYSPKHDGAAVDELLAGYKGTLVADAHAVFDHLYKSGDVIEAACWAQYPDNSVIRSRSGSGHPTGDCRSEALVIMTMATGTPRTRGCWALDARADGMLS
jgi:hypothetical protein